MGLNLIKFIELRPFAYHFTASGNLKRLRQLRCIQSAAELLRIAGKKELTSQRRHQPTSIIVDRDEVVLNDQIPLIFANVSLAPEWREEDLIEHLNKHIYFWPGRSDGPMRYGARFLSHYNKKGMASLRVATRDLIEANCDQAPLFCAFNSGAPRKYDGVAADRGPNLFLPASEFPRVPGKVVELVFAQTVRLPAAIELGTQAGTWSNL